MAAARDKARQMPADRRVIRLSGGVHRVAEPLCLDWRDSGLVLEAQAGQSPIIDGGTRIEGWTPHELDGVKVWRADVRELVARVGRPLRSLFVNSRRAPRARWPKSGFIVPAAVPGNPVEDSLHHGTDRLVLGSDAIAPNLDLRGADMRVLHLWVDERLPVKAYEPASGLVVSSHRTIFMVREGQSGWLRARVFFENVRGALSQPGEWFHDEDAGAVFYCPREGERPDEIEIVTPLAYQFVRIEGDGAAGKPAADIRISGLAFRHAEWVMPEEDWRRRFDPYRPREQWARRDSFEHFINDNGYDPDVAYGSAVQGAFNVHGVIRLTDARGCRVSNCRIEQIGTYGVELCEGCVGNIIERCTMTGLGAGGVNIDGGNIGANPSRQTLSNRVLDNRIEGGGEVFGAACGVLICHSAQNVVAHNEISHLRYTGISVGWQWVRAPHISQRNVIEKNHIHHIEGPDVLSDLAGIYTLGIQPGTVLRGNLIHNIGCDAYGAWGIYLDAASSGILVECNVVYDTRSEAMNNNTGNCENLYRNNVFIAEGAAVGVARRLSDWNEEFAAGLAMTFVRNVVVTLGGSAFRVRPEDNPQRCAQMLVSDANLFWDAASGAAPAMVRDWRGKTLFDAESWQAAGQDRRSVFADPGFADLLSRDLRLGEHSPVRQIGFVPIDLSNAGPRQRAGKRPAAR
jgi:hypothetical protein